MNKAKKYKLKLDYTEEELKELKEISINCSSSINAILEIVESVSDISDDGLFRNLGRKYITLGTNKEFDFVEDINNVVMGTAIFSEEEYVVHDKVTDQYICYSVKKCGLFWRQLEVAIPYKNTQKWWLAINPAYEPMLERL